MKGCSNQKLFFAFIANFTPNHKESMEQMVWIIREYLKMRTKSLNDFDINVFLTVDEVMMLNE